MTEIFDWFMEHIIIPVFLLVLIMMCMILIIGVPVLIYDALQPHTYIQLQADQWVCSNSVTTTTMMYQPSLKMSLPVTSNECVEYRRK